MAGVRIGVSRSLDLLRLGGQRAAVAPAPKQSIIKLHGVVINAIAHRAVAARGTRVRTSALCVRRAR